MNQRKDFKNIIETLKTTFSIEDLRNFSEDELKELRELLQFKTSIINVVLKNQLHQKTHFHPKSKN